MKNSIGVVGGGFVGKAIARGFISYANVRIYDIKDELTSHSLEEVINSDFVFVCLPTPMVSAEGGEANLSIIKNFFREINKLENRNEDTIFIIKSTVPIGTTQKISWEYGINTIVHCPEFLTARSSLIDYICPARHIIGGQDTLSVEKVKVLLEERFPGTPCICMKSDESETVKYMANCFFSTKVLFFNEMYLLIEKLGLDWDKILEGTITDGRIGKSHYSVPGHDGDMGIGGTCVLPDAKVNIHRLNDPSFFVVFGPQEPDYIKKTFYRNRNMTIEDLYSAFIDLPPLQFLQIESCDHKIENIEHNEEKAIKNMTVRDVDEDIYCFHTDNGVFECTEDHLMPILKPIQIPGERNPIIVKAKEIKEIDLFFVKKENFIEEIKINKIEKRKYEGKVYNLELETENTNMQEDDLFWIEQKTGIVTHNCFPKDINSLITTMEKNGIDPLVLKAVWEQNKNVRTNWDWAGNSSAVSDKK
jgi:UDP-glucose 6-dehydrogenase